MKIEITEKQRNYLLAILADANIKGSAWRIIAELEQVLKGEGEVKPLEKVKQ